MGAEATPVNLENFVCGLHSYEVHSGGILCSLHGLRGGYPVHTEPLASGRQACSSAA